VLTTFYRLEKGCSFDHAKETDLNGLKRAGTISEVASGKDKTQQASI